jgi:hypothetical protein
MDKGLAAKIWSLLERGGHVSLRLMREEGGVKPEHGPLEDK